MIHTRRTIFKTLLKRIRELTKHANYSPKEFKKIMIAIILNYLKEWSEYIPNDDSNIIVNLLNELLLDNCFIIERIPVNSRDYTNVNTPQTNETWTRIWDYVKEDSEVKNITTDYSWEVDDSCEISIVYFESGGLEYLYETYGVHGENLKTVCEKMNIFVNRETNEAFYLSTSGEWIQIGIQQGLTEEQVKELIRNSKVIPEWNNENAPEITFSLNADGQGNNSINLLTQQEVEAMI